MTTGKRYITQITADDLRQIAAMVNASPGLGIILDKRNADVMISIDEGQLKRMIYAFCRQAWPASCPSSTAIPVDDIDLGASGV